MKQYTKLIGRESELIKEQLKEFLKQSKEEYQKSKNESLSNIERRAYFQQASEKLYKVMIHVIEIKSGYNIRSHSDLFDSFYWQQANFHSETMETFLSRMNLLHSYFYEGGIYPSYGVERSYKNLLDYINEIIDRFE